MLLHSGGAYATLLGALDRSDAGGQVINLVPSLLEQLRAYAGGEVEDPFLTALEELPGEPSPPARERLLQVASDLPDRALEAWPDLRPLAAAARSREALDAQGLLDLGVLLVLALAGSQASRAPALASLAEASAPYGAGDLETAREWLRVQPRDMLEALDGLGGDGRETATSPWAHPILPLLVDTRVAAEALGVDPGSLPCFRRPEDAAAQLRRGLAAAREAGFQVHGCWPPEGSLSAATVEIYAEQGVEWLVGDEGVLERSLERPLRHGDEAAADLYRPWRLGGRGPLLFFRDRELSDRIGFEYARWRDERGAARDLLRRLEERARTLDEEAAIVLALDGENPWLHYAEGGRPFLEELLGGLESVPGVRPATLHQLAAGAGEEDAGTLERLHPGSWIQASFATWIGHPEKNRGWELLAGVRERLGEEPSRSLLLAEGSDWLWWRGDDNPSPLAPLYDRLFRRHLADACAVEGVEAPEDLDPGEEGVAAG